MSNPEVPTPKEPQEKLDHTEVLARAKQMLESWRWAEHTQAENNQFAFGLAWWAADTYGGQYQPTEEFEGIELPVTLQPLVTSSWRNERFMSNENRIEMKARYSEEVVPPTIPRWDELLEEHVSFPKVLEVIRQSPEIIEGIQLAKSYFFRQVEVEFKPHYYWGLEFFVTESDIHMAVNGQRGHTKAVTEFVQENFDKPRLLSHLVANLALLTIKHGLHRRYVEVTPDDLLRLDGLVHGINLEGIDRSKLEATIPPGSAVVQLVIDTLFEEGYIDGTSNTLPGDEDAS